MGQPEEKSSNRPLTDEQIADEMLEQIGAYCIDSVALENEQLALDLARIDDALTSHGIDDWMSVWSIINVLTEKTEIDKLVNEVPPTSRFYKKYEEVDSLVGSLELWMEEGLISSQDSMVKVFNILTTRRKENSIMLGTADD